MAYSKERDERQERAERLRHRAYLDAIQRLVRSDWSLEQAVIYLRIAYNQAERVARGMWSA